MSADPEILSGVPLFQALDDDERREVAALMLECRFPEATTLFREGDAGGVLYVITEGRVELSVRDQDRNKLVIDLLEGGEFFGEVSLLDGGVRSATATAVESVVAYSLAREPLLELLRRRADVALDLLVAVGRRIRRTDENIRRSVRNPNEVVEESATLGERVADGVARFGGSWKFIFSFGAILLVWVAANTFLVSSYRSDGQPFDPYPFILLNLGLSMLAALQAPVIMMSQNRQDAKDRVRNDLEYQVNVKAELEIAELLERVDVLKHRLERIEDRLAPAER